MILTIVITHIPALVPELFLLRLLIEIAVLSVSHALPVAPTAGGNIFGLIVGKITDVVLQWAEYLVNWAIEKVESAVCGWFGCNFGRVCLTVGENVYRCEHAWGGDDLSWLLGCGYREDTRLARQCFFARQRAICMEGDPSRYTRYQKLFEAPNKAELEQDFWSIVGK